MPAKTVKDLIDLNASVPDELKVKVRIYYQSDFEGKLVAEYIDATTGNRIYQHSQNRSTYYGVSIDFDQKEEDTEESLPRAVDPTNKPTYPFGFVTCKKNASQYQCNNAWFVGTASAAQGYGPMLYDCLLAKLGEKGFGLTSDRSLVSTKAGRVWVEYLTSRPDVEKKPLDYDRSTPPLEDDCYSHHEKDKEWNAWLNEPKKKESETEEKFEKRKEKTKLINVAVKTAYFDNGITTLKELRDAGLLVEENLNFENKINLKELQKLYESFLKQIKG